MLVELLRPAGVELARRWLAALVLVPEGERAAVVESVERRIVETYGVPPAAGDAEPSAGRAGVTPEPEVVTVAKKARRAERR